MIYPLDIPIEPKYRVHGQRTNGRYEGLLDFAMKLGNIFATGLKHWAVLDVGAADGWLGEILVCGRYLAVDPAGFTVVAVGEALPIKPRSVDLVVAKQVLPHMTDPVQACREMLAVARHAVVIRQDWGYRAPDGQYLPIGWPGHSRTVIEHPDDILAALRAPGWTATYDDTDFVARRRTA